MHNIADSQFSSEDRRWMQLAIDIARGGQGHVEPNPMVGCVLVADNRAIGQGLHERFGGPHAERMAISDALRRGNRDQLAGSTAYVSLEPCCHHGKTPPCTHALIESRVARVVVAMLDPFAEVQGRGTQQLSQAGMLVQVGLEAQAAQQLNAPYLKRTLCNRPWIIAKWAMSLDGKIATRTGHSQWISAEPSRARVHQLRAVVDAILVGSGTALSDDPLLTARTSSPPPRTALRVVADSRLRLAVHSRLVQTAHEIPTLLWAGPQADLQRANELRQAGCTVEICPAHDPNERLDELLRYLAAQRGVTNLLVEGGGQLLGGLLEIGQIDQCEVFIAPKLLGSDSAASPIAGLGFATVDAGPTCEQLETSTSGPDVHLRCRLNWTAHTPSSRGPQL